MREPTVRPSDQVLIIGKNGSGKSILARRLFDHVASQKVALDVKRDDDLVAHLERRYGDELAIVDADLERFDHYMSRRRVIVYRPASAYARDEYHRVYQRIARRRNVTTWLDEAYGPTEANSFPEAVGTYLQHGRSRNLRHIACTQRPVRIAKALLTEAHHVVLFPRGFSANDLDTVAQEMGVNRRALEQIAAPLVQAEHLPVYGRFGHLWYEQRTNTIHRRPSVRP